MINSRTHDPANRRASNRVDRAGPGPDPRASERQEYRLRYQELFDFAADSLLMTDVRGIILEANHAAATLFQYTREFLIDKPLGLLVHEAQRRRFYDRLGFLAFGGTVEFESRIGRPANYRDVIFRAVTIDTIDRKASTCRWCVRDVTDRKQAEDARTELLRRLVTSQEDERRRVSRARPRPTTTSARS